MRISVQKLPRETSESAVAIVVDVLRATSVIATALNQGAEQIITCLEIEESRRIAATLTPRPLLCGERLCKPISGFDLGNSPCDYSCEVVAGRTLVMTTTNGTRALASAQTAKAVYAGAFVNLSAVAAQVTGDEHLVVVCAGTDGKETDEDVLFAGALIAKIVELKVPVILDDDASDAGNAWQVFLNQRISLAEKLGRSRGGRNLVQAGYQADIDHCAEIDSVAAVPVMVSRDPLGLKVVR